METVDDHLARLAGGVRLAAAARRPSLPGSGHFCSAPAGGRPRTPADPARLAAWETLRAVAERDAYANLVLPAVLRRAGLSGRDAGLATELAYGALRGRGTYDAVLAAWTA